jgi:Suppressor of fused protein (SUFU)
MDLINHIEKFSGKITGGWTLNRSGDKQRFQVGVTEAGPLDGTICYFTIGVSNFETALPDGRKVRQEFVFISRKDVIGFPIVPAMQSIANAVIDAGKPLLRGEVVTFGESMFEGTEMVALYASNPVYFDDQFASFDAKDGTPAALCWLFPITQKELNCIDENGWGRFEDLLSNADPDLVDFYRNSIPTG